MTTAAARLVLLIVLTVAALPWAASPVRAQAVDALPAQTAASLRAAAGRDLATLDSAMIMAIVQMPGRAQEIVRAAAELAPGHAQALAASAARVFPAFAAQLRPADTAPAAAVAAGAASRWSGKVEAGGSRSTGNSETEQASAAARALYESGRWAVDSRLSYEFARQDKETSAQRLVASIEPRYDLSERLYTFAFVQYEDDRFSGFDYEVTESVGLGYRLIKRERLKLTVEAGPGARQSKVKSTGKTENEFVGRGNAELEWRISDSATFSNETTVTAGSERTVTENTTALELAIVDPLSAKLSFTVRNNSDPPAGKDDTDTLTKASLVYEF